MEKLTVEKFYNDRKSALELILLAGAGGLSKPIESREVQRPSMALMGWYEGFAAQRIQVIGRTEITYLQHLDQKQLRETLERL